MMRRQCRRVATTVCSVAGAPGRTRTSDRRIRSPLLYPAELRARDPGRGSVPGRARRPRALRPWPRERRGRLASAAAGVGRLLHVEAHGPVLVVVGRHPRQARRAGLGDRPAHHRDARRRASAGWSSPRARTPTSTRPTRSSRTTSRTRSSSAVRRCSPSSRWTRATRSTSS